MFKRTNVSKNATKSGNASCESQVVMRFRELPALWSTCISRLKMSSRLGKPGLRTNRLRVLALSISVRSSPQVEV